MKEPIVFEPLAMERVWGGRRLETLLGKKLPDGGPIGELWEVVDREEAQSVVASGEFAGKTLHDLWTNERAKVFGAAFAEHPAPRFPLLVKLLDASEKLSVQVHPPRHMAAALGGEPKTEVWYFLETTPEANIYAGLRSGTTRAEFERLLREGGVEQALHDIPVRSGESIFIPSGRLHIEQSLASIDFQDFEPSVKSASDPLVADCPLFRVEKNSLAGPSDLRPAGRFALVVSLDATVSCGGREFQKGQFFLVPAEGRTLSVAPVGQTATVLVTTLPI